MEDYPTYDPGMRDRNGEQWHTVYADDGDYRIRAHNLREALQRFARTHPRSYAISIVNDDMRPRLILESD
jgi:hypothetical protein